MLEWETYAMLALCLLCAATAQKHCHHLWEIISCQKIYPKQPLGKGLWRRQCPQHLQSHFSNRWPWRCSVWGGTGSGVSSASWDPLMGGRQRRKMYRATAHAMAVLQIARGLCSAGLSIWHHSWAIKSRPQSILQQTACVMNTLILL